MKATTKAAAEGQFERAFREERLRRMEAEEMRHQAYKVSPQYVDDLMARRRARGLWAPYRTRS